MKLTIIGASGHGKVIAEIAELCGYDEIEFVDDNESIRICGTWPVVGTLDLVKKLDNDVFVAIGNTNIRKKIMEEISDNHMPILIHPKAIVSSTAKINRGTVVMAGAVINPYAEIGQGSIVNTMCSIDHDCQIGDYCHISVGAHLSGTVKVCEGTWIGAGATVSNNINICSGVIIGAGAVVVKDIDEPGTYVGVPAKILVK